MSITIGTTIHDETVEVRPLSLNARTYCVTVDGMIVGSTSGRYYWSSEAAADALALSLVPQHRRIGDSSMVPGSLQYWQERVAELEASYT